MADLPSVFLAPEHNGRWSIFQQHCCLHSAEPSVRLRGCGWKRRRGPITLVTLRSVCSLFFLLCVVECLTVCNAKLTFFVSSIVWHLSHLQAQSSLRDHSVATLSQTHPRLCKPHMCFHLVWFVVHFNRFCGLPPFRASPLEHMLLGVKITAFGLWSQTQPMALHKLSAITSDRNGSFIFVQIFLATLAVLVQYSAHISSSSFLNRTKCLIAFVSHALILSNVAQLQDQFSPSKQKTL